MLREMAEKAINLISLRDWYIHVIFSTEPVPT